MKKIRFISMALCLLMLVLCFASCEELISSLGTSQNGLSAYEIAVKNGFVGTEQEWLESLKGETVYVPQEPSDTTPPVINQTITDNNITINAPSGDVLHATTKGLSSVVSVFATFTSDSEEYSSGGAGVFYKLFAGGDAFVITNYHVVYDQYSDTENKISDDIVLYLYGMEYVEYAIKAEYVGGSMSYDLAVLRVEDSKVLEDAMARGTVREADVTQTPVSVGETVIAVGNPSAEGIAATSGIVSVDSEYIKMTGADNSTEIELRVIRTDTPINQGNSGGGLFNSKGELVGIVNAKIISTDVENIGYAIPSGVFTSICDNIIHYCYGTDCESVMRPLLGITLQVKDMWTELDMETGLLVRHESSEIVLIGENALAQGKLQLGDVVKGMKVGEKTVMANRQYEIIDALINARAGDTVIVIIERVEAGQSVQKEISITITEESITAQK